MTHRDKNIKHRFLDTEKSHFLRVINQLVLVTPSYITKKDISHYLNLRYDVKIIKINSLVCKGKTKTSRKVKVKLSNKKKFYITIEGSLEKFKVAEKNNA